MTIRFSLAGPDLIKLTAQVQASAPFADTIPDRVEVDYEDQPPTLQWGDLLSQTARNLTVAWGDVDNPDQSLNYYPGACIHVEVDLPPEAQRVQGWLAALDFEVAVFATLHDNWRDIEPDYVPPVLPTRHYRFGWALAIKGAARKRIVSERWPAYSPARVEERDDLIFIQFHDPKADAATSLAQAKAAHRAFSSDAEGGFIKEGYLLRHDFKGVYDEKSGVLKVAVLGRSISPREMLDACALRLEGELPNGKSVKNVAYVFLDEREIGEHLHQLWLRGLECWTIREGREVRLDDTYDPPPPVVVDWAK